MPSNNETILIDVSFETNDLEARAAKVRAELSALRTANKELKKDVDAMTETSAESARQLALNEEAIKMDQAALKTLDAQIVDAVNTNADYGDSLNEMRAKLASLQRSYAALSKEERESARGTELLEHIQELRTEVGNLESSMGNSQRNVGNYTSSIEQALKNMGTTGGVNLKSLTGSVQSFGKVFETGDLEARAARIRAEIGLLQSANKALKKDVDAATESSAESAKQLALNTEAIKLNKAELKLLDQQIVSAEKSNEQYSRSVDDVRSEIESARKNLANLTAEQKTLTLTLMAGGEGYEETKKQLDEVNLAIEKQGKELVSLEGEIVNAEKSNEQYSRSVDDVRSEIESARNNLANLTAEQKTLTLALMAGGEGYEETKKQLDAVNLAIEEQGKELVALEGEVAQAVVTTETYGDILMGMRAELSSLQNEYAALSVAERESAKGTELLGHIQELRVEVGNLESSMGNSQRNVGNYTSSIEQALKNMETTGGVNLKSLTGSVQSFGKVFETGDLEARAARIRAEIGLLQSANKALKKDVDAATESSAESAKQLALNTEAIKADKAELKMLDQQIVNAEKSNEQYSRSVDDIRSEIDSARKNLANLTTEQKTLTLALMAGGEGYEETKKQLDEVNLAIEEQGKELVALEGEVAQAVVTTETYGDSLIGMRAELSSLQNEYAALSAAERESAKGTELLGHIQELRVEVGNLESSMGDNRRNVGNYTSSIEQALKSMGTTGGVNLKSLTTSVKSFGNVFITYPLNVITALLAAIMAVIKGVTDAFKKNGEAMTALQAAFSAFEPVLKLVSDAFQALAGVIAKVVTAVTNVVTSILGKLIPSYKQAADAARELVLAQDALEESERQYTVNSARRAAEISRLRNEAQSKDKSLDERKKALEQAIALEREDLEEQRRIATERLRIAQEQAKRENDTSDATKNNIANLQAAVFTAEKNYEDGIRRLSSSLQSFNKAEKNATNAAVQAAAERKRAADEAAQAEADAYTKEVEDLNNRQQAAAIEAVQLRLNETQRGSEEEYQLRLQFIDMQRARELQNTELLESERASIEEKYRQQEEQASRTRDAGRRAELLEDMRAALEEQNALIEEEGESAETRAANRQLQEAQNYLNFLLQLDEETRAILFPEEGSYAAMLTAQLEQVEAAEQKLTASTQKDIDERVKKWQSFTSAVSKSTSQIIGSLGDMAGESEKAAALQASVQMAEILTNEALALARGTAASQTLPFPANIAALVTTIAQITSQFATVFKTFSQSGFAAGGIVAGNAYTGDRLTARVNSGEMILNGSQQARLFELANSPMGGGGGGFDYETLTASLSEAVAAQPAPVMDYKEFTTFQQRTALYKEYANIRK